MSVESFRYVERVKGFESKFRFDKIEKPESELLELTHRRLLDSMLTFCCVCGKVRRSDGQWVGPEAYLSREHNASISHGYCPECYEENKARIKP